jgi:protein SCO1/2
MSRKSIYYLLFFGLLVFGFFIALAVIVPDFGKPKIKPIGELQPFSFVNQDGKRVTDQDVRGKVVAVEFFFTTCKGICPRMNNNMKEVYETFRSEKDFLILSHTSDPATDSAQRLKWYADSMGVDTEKWIFLTGRKDSLYEMARYSYKVDDPANNVANIEDDFLHTQFVALMNRKGEVVRIYDALKPSEMKEMNTLIRKLL